MAGVEQCITALSTAFQEGAELVQVIQERRTKNVRRSTEDEREQAYGEKMLHQALADSAEKCRSGSEQRKYRFGSSFGVGDSVAVSEFGLIMANLQIQVLSILQQIVDLAEEDTTMATLDVVRLHEAVITAKSNTLRSMDELCQRIVCGTTRKDESQIRHFGSMELFAHQNMSSFSIHDSVIDYRNRVAQQQNASTLLLDTAAHRRHTMTGIENVHHTQVQQTPSQRVSETLPSSACIWPISRTRTTTSISSTSSSCRSVSSTTSSISCRSSMSLPPIPPTTFLNNNNYINTTITTTIPTAPKLQRLSIPEATPSFPPVHESHTAPKKSHRKPLIIRSPIFFFSRRDKLSGPDTNRLPPLPPPQTSNVGYVTSKSTHPAYRNEDKTKMTKKTKKEKKIKSPTTKALFPTKENSSFHDRKCSSPPIPPPPPSSASTSSTPLARRTKAFLGRVVVSRRWRRRREEDE